MTLAPHFGMSRVTVAVFALARCAATATGGAEVEIAGSLQAHAMASHANCRFVPGSRGGLLGDFCPTCAGCIRGFPSSPATSARGVMRSLTMPRSWR